MFAQSMKRANDVLVGEVAADVKSGWERMAADEMRTLGSPYFSNSEIR